MGLGPAYGYPGPTVVLNDLGTAMAAPVNACAGVGTFAITAGAGVFETLGSPIGRLRVTAPATGRFIFSRNIHGAADGKPAEQKVMVRTTIDGVPVEYSEGMIVSNNVSNNLEATCSCARAITLTVGQVVEIEVSRSVAQSASIISGPTGCTGVQLTQIPLVAHS